MIKFIFVVGFIAAAAANDNIKFTDCGHHEITTIQFDGCTSADSFCKVYKGKSQAWKISFKANQDTSTVKFEMFANVGGVEIQVPGIQSNGCDGMIKCPVVKGQEYTFTYMMNLPSLIPNIRTTVVAKMSGEHGVLSCGKMTGEVL